MISSCSSGNCRKISAQLPIPLICFKTQFVCKMYAAAMVLVNNTMSCFYCYEAPMAEMFYWQKVFFISYSNFSQVVLLDFSLMKSGFACFRVNFHNYIYFFQGRKSNITYFFPQLQAKCWPNQFEKCILMIQQKK